MPFATEKFANKAQSTLAGALNNVATTLTLTSAASFPGSGNFRLRIDSEILLCTGVSGNVLTVVRGIEGTTAASHANLAGVTQIITAAGQANNPLAMNAAFDEPYLDDNGNQARLAASTTNRRVFRTSQGTGSAAQAPQWHDLAEDQTNLLETANGVRSLLVEKGLANPQTPTILGVGPSSSYLAGALVTVHGSGFATGVSVTFGGQAAFVLVATNTEIVCQVPPRTTAGSVDVVVTNQAAPGLSGPSATLSNGFTYAAMTFTGARNDLFQAASPGMQYGGLVVNGLDQFVWFPAVSITGSIPGFGSTPSSAVYAIDTRTSPPTFHPIGNAKPYHFTDLCHVSHAMIPTALGDMLAWDHHQTLSLIRNFNGGEGFSVSTTKLRWSGDPGLPYPFDAGPPSIGFIGPDGYCWLAGATGDGVTTYGTIFRINPRDIEDQSIYRYANMNFTGGCLLANGSALLIDGSNNALVQINANMQMVGSPVPVTAVGTAWTVRLGNDLNPWLVGFTGDLCYAVKVLASDLTNQTPFFIPGYFAFDLCAGTDGNILVAVRNDGTSSQNPSPSDSKVVFVRPSDGSIVRTQTLTGSVGSSPSFPGALEGISCGANGRFYGPISRDPASGTQGYVAEGY